MRLFTREEAEALLPALEAHVRTIQRCKREIDGLRAYLAETAERSSGNGHLRDQGDVAAGRRRAEALVDELNEHLQAINATGAELKDPDTGLLDFPGERDGRTVYLCWRLGEARIAWWHELDAGFAGRQPLDPPAPT